MALRSRQSLGGWPKVTLVTRVIHTGQALVDLVVEVGAIPRRGGNVMAQSFTRYAGGSVSVLAAAARSGAEAVHAGAHGTGPNGDLIRDALAAEGVTLSAEPVEGADTAVCVVLVEPTAERTFVTTLGAERQITPESLGASEPVPGDLVCVTGYSLLEPTRDPLLTWLESLADGVRVVLDPGAAFAGLETSVRDRMLVLTDVWTSNAEEARELTGLEELTATAREGRTQPAEMADGTFTITNVGVFGVDGGTPIINPGESAILAMGAIKPQPWAVPGADGEPDAIAVRRVTTLSLSFDHRHIDGATGSRFLADVAGIVADPATALLF